MTPSNKLSILILLLILVLLPGMACADMFEKGLKLRAGGFWAQLDSTINAEVPGTNIGQEVDFESDLGLEESRFSPFFEATYRFNKRHAVMVNYLSLHRSGTRAAISKPFEFEFDGNTYRVAAGVRLDSILDLDVYQAAYMYNFYSSDKLMVAGTLGAHIAQLKTEFTGQIGLVGGGGSVVASGRTVNESVTAPLPDIGLQSYYYLGYGALLGIRAQYFQLKIEDIDGRLLDLRGEVLKYLNKSHNWALGVAYQYYGVEVDYQAANSTLDAQLNYHGPSVFVQYDF